jgi:hypothetical protein
MSLSLDKAQTPGRPRKKVGEYNDDMSFVHGRDWAKKYNELRELCQEYKRDNILFRAELRAAKGSLATTKRKMRESLGWDGEEANLAENVGYFCRAYLFPRYNFLKEKWDVLTQINTITCQILLEKELKSQRVWTIVKYGIE